jgi:hypothetical protein
MMESIEKWFSQPIDDRCAAITKVQVRASHLSIENCWIYTELIPLGLEKWDGNWNRGWSESRDADLSLAACFDDCPMMESYAL